MKQHNSEAKVIGTGLALFVVISIFFILRSDRGDEYFPPLSTYSPRPNGAMALYELLEESGQPVGRHVLSAYDYPLGSTVALLDQSAPDASTLLLGGLDVKALTIWMRRGGTFIMASSTYSTDLSHLFDEIASQAGSPLHSMSYGFVGDENRAWLESAGILTGQALHDRSGIASPTTNAYALSRISQSGEIYSLVQPAPDLFAGVNELEIARPGFISRFPGVAILEADDPPQPLVVWLPIGEGGLYWLSAPELASNDWIERVDNHRLLLNLLRQASGGETVWFDEYHHGYREQGPSATGLIFQTAGGRLMLAALFLIALAFAGSAISPARFMPTAVPPRRQSTEMVLAQGSLYQRAGLKRPIATHLLDGLRHAVRQYEHWGSPPDDERLAAWLHAAATRGLPVDPMLLQVMDGRLALGSERQLWIFARACDRLRNAL